jgi:hypothetical protein
MPQGGKFHERLLSLKLINKKPRPTNGRGCFLECEEAKLSQTGVIWPPDNDVIEHLDFKELTGAN